MKKMQMIKNIYLDNDKETREIGFKLGKLLKPGSIVCLIGDLGAGKTTMTQSLAEALEVDDYITSPTFTIVNEYEGKMPLYHFDVYRIGCRRRCMHNRVGKYNRRHTTRRLLKNRIKIQRHGKRDDTYSLWRRIRKNS